MNAFTDITENLSLVLAHPTIRAVALSRLPNCHDPRESVDIGAAFDNDAGLATRLHLDSGSKLNFAKDEGRSFLLHRVSAA